MTFIFRLWNFLKAFCQKWHWYAGAAPEKCPPWSLILFPRLTDTLCCGLAGILSVKGAAKGTIKDFDLFAARFQQVKSHCLRDVCSPSASLISYLEGGKHLQEMEGYLLRMKSDVFFQELFSSPELNGKMARLAAEMKDFLCQEETALEEKASFFMTDDLERIYRHLTIIRDLVWGMERDILETLPQIRKLSRADEFGLDAGALLKYRRINFLLNCLNRLEIRGRDSAGMQVVFTADEESVFQRLKDVLIAKNLYYDDFVRRATNDDLGNYSITAAAPQNAEKAGRSFVRTFAFTYKTASVIGKLGQNVGDLAQYIRDDAVLREFAQTGMACASTLCHTRWASVGSISPENCHPVNNAVMSHHSGDAGGERNFPFYGSGYWSVNVALNGDIDNYHDLRGTWESDEKWISPEVTTDTKIIPLQVENYLARGYDLTTSFRLALNDFEGSHAIAMTSNLEPGKVFLALRGSGQALYVGLCEEQYLFSSELYGLVERTPFFIPLSGEVPADHEHQEATGQLFVLDNEGPGGLDGITAFFYNGTPLKLTPEHVRRAEITTRDINRGEFSHYFLKEIFESPRSVHQTMLGKYRMTKNSSGDVGVSFNLGSEILPEKIKNDLLRRRIRRIILIGHGTAAVAGHAISDAMTRYLRDTGIIVETKVASELSGFSLARDLSDTILIPISQSGTTTDTNRAVAMSRERGAAVIAIVNRRQSDITAKADGVFYTSDGRDVEMSVASTKAFYSQIVAGHILGLAFAWLLKSMPEGEIIDELTALEEAPLLMNRVLSKKEEIRKAARETSKHKTYWAVVGSGPNKAAADEIRIKLSELCYKTISSDIVENKKHIDLSAEPLILVCSAGNPETVIGDIIKDAAIFKAHKASVIVFCDEGEERFDTIADAVIKVPRKEQPLPVILNTIAGHLFGFYAALSIDEDALFLRTFRNKLNKQMALQDKELLPLYARIDDRRLHWLVREFSPQFNARRNQGDFRAVNNKTIADIVLLLKYCAGFLKMEDGYADDFGTGDSPVDLLDVSLGTAIDELSRPVDAIRHQAKTVTVGTSRKEQPLSGILFDLLKQLSFTEQSLSMKSMTAIMRIQPAIADICGYTLYVIDGLDAYGKPTEETTIAIQSQGGVALQIASRVKQDSHLMGTKRTITSTRKIHIGRGKSDGRSLVIIPLKRRDGKIGHLLLVHVTFDELLSVKDRIAVMAVYFYDLKNLINEYNLPWSDDYLARIPLDILLGESVDVIAEQIRSSIV